MAVKKSELYSLLWEACNKLRGGVEPSRYKDYVLVLLFFKYVSDRYKGQPFAEFTVSQGASFDDLIAAKGRSDIGERVDKILQKFLEDNRLQGALPDVSFNNREELGSGKELVDRVTGLIGVFQNPAIDFKNNRASGDDIIGDAYEYFMMKFAQESGKSKGQFYTPSEVSRIIARLIGIGDIKQMPNKKWTLHDPAAGSGSLLIRAADEAPMDENGDSIVTIFGQEKYPDTAGLAKMNFVLHNKGTGEIKSGNTLADPQYLDEFGELKKFDFIVMNPPFSDKDWTDGITTTKDKFRRFDGFGIPPEKNGDYAWFLHVLKALDSNGKAGIILPHGVLFRGNAEESIRIEVLKKKYIKGIVSLPGNLFYGTGIPACIIIIDKENADERDGIFLIDASRGYKKDGNKNRLREQDIEKIVQTFTHRLEIKGYSRFVKYSDILEGTDINALCGIIGKKEIWFGSAEHMNDREELIGFINDLEKEVYACIDSANKGKANEVFSQIKNRMQKEYPYIFCVSKARNDAAQWDRYAQGGQGVAIVFNTETLFKLIFYNQIIMNEEYYGYCAKQHKTKELLRDYIQYDKMDDFSNLNGLIDNLLLCAMFHKHESFSSEQEIRISPLFVNENDKHLQCKVLNTIRQVYILNLAELCEKERIDFEDLFDSIVIGPTSKQTIRDLQIYCKNNGLLKLANKVKKSDCPLR